MNRGEAYNRMEFKMIDTDIRQRAATSQRLDGQYSRTASALGQSSGGSVTGSMISAMK